MRRSVGIFWVLVWSMLAALVAGGCSSTPPYKTFSFEHRTKPNAQYPVEQVTHFSFEYPRGYKRSGTYAKDDPVPPIIVWFARATGTFGCVRRTDTIFGVNVGWSPESGNATEAASRALSALGDGGLVRERSSVMVGGLTGEQVVYHDPRQPNAPEVRAVFFDYEGRIWEIYIYSETARAEQAKLDFDHIIQTFKILP